MDRDKRDNLILLKPKYLFSRLTLGGTLSLSVPAQARFNSKSAQEVSQPEGS